jgi:hypothetical protein
LQAHREKQITQTGAMQDVRGIILVQFVRNPKAIRQLLES